MPSSWCGCGGSSQMVLLEGWRARHQQIGKSVQMCNRRIHSWMWASYTSIGVFLFGCACSQLTTDIAKYSVGRLRPHFVSVCKPDWSKVRAYCCLPWWCGDLLGSQGVLVWWEVYNLNKLSVYMCSIETVMYVIICYLLDSIQYYCVCITKINMYVENHN